MEACKAVVWLTVLAGAVLMLSGWWLSSPENAVAFGVSPQAWMTDFVAGLLVLVIGGIAKAGCTPRNF